MVGQCEKCEKRHKQLHPLKSDCREDDVACLLAAEQEDGECECLPCRIHDFIVGIKWMKPSEIWGDVSKSLLLYFLSTYTSSVFGGGGGAGGDGVELLHVFGIGIIATAVAKHVESLLEHHHGSQSSDGQQQQGSKGGLNAALLFEGSQSSDGQQQQGSEGGLNAALLFEGGLLCSTFQVVLKGLHELVPESLNVKLYFNQVLEHMEGTLLASIADA